MLYQYFTALLFLVFSDTHLERDPNETIEQRNVRAFMFAYKYFAQHLSSRGIQVVILSDDPDFKTKAGITDTDNVLFANGTDYVMSMTKEFQGLEDKLCRIPYNEDEGLLYLNF